MKGHLKGYAYYSLYLYNLQLLDLFHDLSEAVYQVKSCNIFYVDYGKAFDIVPLIKNKMSLVSEASCSIH